MIWDLKERDRNNPGANQFGFRLAQCDPAERAQVLGLLMTELGQRATVAPSSDSYYNYTITLASGATYEWLHGLLWSFLMHRLGIPVRLY